MDKTSFCSILPPKITLQIIIIIDFNQFHLTLFDILSLTVSYLSFDGCFPQFVTILYSLENSQMGDFSLRRGELSN